MVKYKKEEGFLMKLKKLIVTLLVSLTICTATTSIAVPPILTEAHGGRTDSNGGHKDKNNVSGLGSYHYHHGYPAHLHPDGICPYANSTASASSGSATTSSGSKYTKCCDEYWRKNRRSDHSATE